ncbi:TauD/TfdA family dioxygenase [Orrella marina]|uniref:Taurine catabolism dioxygenase TauD n=1 Tax=Orrella marina TaxID=2163011 RepID=A0A2R4XH70_9BURK|nr:TauD/TfdA family dioxygenase [Orrella marina]AWB33104.1 taurine catabolism dioxygenase TauD [Orrella marina]
MSSIFTGLQAWTAKDFEGRDDWVTRFTEAELQEIDAIAQGKEVTFPDLLNMGKEDFKLPLIDKKFVDIREQLEGGRGFAVLRGVPVQKYSLNQARKIFWALASHLGTPQPQDKAGSLLHDVTNTGRKVATTGEVRGFQTDDELSFHNDGGDAFMLLCLRTAKEGGISKLVSVATIFNEILRTRPDLVEVLQQPFHFDTREQHPLGLKIQSIPIMNVHEGKVSALYKRRYIETAQRFEEVPRLTEQQIEAMNLFEKICHDPEFQLSFSMQAGDIQMGNNYGILHSRTKYLDHDDPGMKRHLLRTWLTLENGRPLPKVFENAREFRFSYLARLEEGHAA